MSVLCPSLAFIPLCADKSVYFLPRVFHLSSCCHLQQSNMSPLLPQKLQTVNTPLMKWHDDETTLRQQAVGGKPFWLYNFHELSVRLMPCWLLTSILQLQIKPCIQHCTFSLRCNTVTYCSHSSNMTTSHFCKNIDSNSYCAQSTNLAALCSQSLKLTTSYCSAAAAAFRANKSLSSVIDSPLRSPLCSDLTLFELLLSNTGYETFLNISSDTTQWRVISLSLLSLLNIIVHRNDKLSCLELVVFKLSFIAVTRWRTSHAHQ